MTLLAALLLTLGTDTPRSGELAGYLIVPHDRVDERYDAGFSMYVAAWPLLKHYPGQQFQSGLFGTWMFAQFPDPKPKDHYSDIEGGLGWWRDTRFATETPKFIMGGVALNFSEWANGPGAGKGRDWSNPTGLYGVAQLSPWVIWPPDGLNLKQGTRGELFGYGYLPLPLTNPKVKTLGKEVPTGNQCWTLFLNTANFKGPVAFFTPHFWAKASALDPGKAGMFLDTRPSDANRAIQMETQHVPASTAADKNGTLYARVAPTQFPETTRPLIHRVTAYGRAALWDQVDAWFKGGKPASGRIDPAASAMSRFKSEGYATWKIDTEAAKPDKPQNLDWPKVGSAVALDPWTYGYRWSSTLPTAQGLVTLPEAYRLGKTPNGDPIWVAIDPKDIPAETGLSEVRFDRAPRGKPEPYVTPDDPKSSWKNPGPVAGPFRVRLGDGSVVTYWWYRFADQPALLNADLTRAEREAMQKRVEKLHRTWTKQREYLPPPTVGALAHLDPAVLVKPPKGLEVGYVPIVTRQEAP